MLEFASVLKYVEKDGDVIVYLKVNDNFKERTKKQLEKLLKNNDSEAVKVSISKKYNSKTLNQNNYIWLIYDLMADIFNNGKIGQEAIKKEDLYLQDIRAFARRVPSVIKKKHLDDFKKSFYIFDDEIEEKGDGSIKVVCYERLSKFTVEQACLWIDMLLDRIATMDIPKKLEGQARLRWEEFNQYKNDMKYILYQNQTEMSKDQYRMAVQSCEMCGNTIHEHGHIHHIKARGMGGNPEPWKEQPLNWLHLHAACHNYYHKVGAQEVIKEYPWLKYKIEKALKLKRKE